ILIDPQTNATVGAVMIQETLSPLDRAQRTWDAVTPHNGKVTLEERIDRNGHRPAIFAVAGDHGAAEQLECGLLQREFATALIDYREIPTPARRSLFCTLWNLGLVIVSWHPSAIGAREKHFFGGIAGKSYLDLSNEGSSTAEETAVKRALKIAETLKLE